MSLITIRRRRIAALTTSTPYHFYDMTAAGGFTNTGGKVSTLFDLGTATPKVDLTQTVDADRPAVGTLTDTTEAMLFTSAEEWLTGNAFATLMNDASTAVVEIQLVFELDNTATQQAFVIWSNTGSNNDYIWVGQNGGGDIRVIRRTEGGVQKATDSAAVLSTGVTHVMSLRFEAGVLVGYLDDDLIFDSVDYVGLTTDLTCNQFNIGSRVLIGASLGMEGRISSFKLTSE